MELSTFSKCVKVLPALHKNEVEGGDRIMVKTRNSTYFIRVPKEKCNKYFVTGGHFDRKNKSPFKTSITGCGLGSAFVKVDLLAAHGLRIEFGNRVITSTIKAFVVFKEYHLN